MKGGTRIYRFMGMDCVVQILLGLAVLGAFPLVLSEYSPSTSIIEPPYGQIIFFVNVGLLFFWQISSMYIWLRAGDKGRIPYLWTMLPYLFLLVLWLFLDANGVEFLVHRYVFIFLFVFAGFGLVVNYMYKVVEDYYNPPKLNRVDNEGDENVLDEGIWKSQDKD